MKENKNNVRKNDFWNSNSPLTSRRVRNILSNPVNSQKLVAAVRGARIVQRSQDAESIRTKGTFKLSKKG